MIDVDITSTVRSDLDARLLKRAAVAALRPHVKRASVSIAVIGAARMRSLNRDALGHDYVTDVLSFNHGDSPEGLLCELFVCPDFARASARRHNVPAEQELARYVVHGCLHCAGYDDATKKDRMRMWHEQERVLRALFGRRYVDSPAG